MPFATKCPSCGAAYNISDNLLGKTIRCQKCQKTFQVAAPSKDKPAAPPAKAGPAATPSAKEKPAAPPSKGAAPAKAGNGPSPLKKGPPPAKTAPRPVSVKDEPLDDLDEAEKAPPKKKGGSTAKVLLLVGGIVGGLLLVCCGGVGAVGYYLYSVGSNAVAGMTSAKSKFDEDWKKLQENPDFPFDPKDFPKDPGIKPPVDPGKKPPDPGKKPADTGKRVGDPGNPPNGAPPPPPKAAYGLDDALKDLKAIDAPRREKAVDWLTKATVDPARQATVAKALEEPLADRQNYNLRAGAARALEKWGTKDSVPALVEALSAESLEGIPGEAPKAMMRALAALKDERGAAPIIPWLGQFFVWGDANNALRTMGPVAEKEVLKAYHHPNGDIRGKARELLRGYGTKDTAVVLQSVQDLKSDDVNRRNSAADWLARARPDDTLRPQVNKELEDVLLRGDGQTREGALRVLDKWGTKDSVPVLIKIVEDLDTSDPANRARHQAIDLLGKLKDERSAAALAERLTHPNDRQKAAQALRGIGPAAIPEVRKHIDDPDKGVQDEVKRLLVSLGSKENFDMTKAIAGLKSSDEVLRRDSVKYFTTGAVDKDRQAEVAKLLAECLEDTDAMTRDQAARALVAWATPDTVPALLKAVDHPANAVKQPAMEALGKLKEETAAKPLAEHLAVVADRKIASAALIAIGAKAEDEVAKQLASKDKAVQLEACKVLQAIGTKASVPALEAAAQAATKAKLKDVTDAANAAAAEAGKR